MLLIPCHDPSVHHKYANGYRHFTVMNKVVKYNRGIPLNTILVDVYTRGLIRVVLFWHIYPVFPPGTRVYGRLIKHTFYYFALRHSGMFNRG